MLSFKKFIGSRLLYESSSIDDTALGHLSHGFDIFHESPEHTQLSLNAMRAFHQIRIGNPDKSGIKAFLKHDGGVSAHWIHTDDGVIGVSDKHRMGRKSGPVIMTTPEEIQKHLGDKPAYATAMTHLLKAGHEILPRNTHIQGDLLYTEGEGSPEDHGPNRIRYRPKQKTTAKIGFAAHTQVTDGLAHSLEGGVLFKTPNVHMPEHVYHPDPNSYHQDDRNGFEHHSNEAMKLLGSHTTKHLSDQELKGELNKYFNRSARGHDYKTGKVHNKPLTPTVDGFIEHIRMYGHDLVSGVSSSGKKSEKKTKIKSMIDHIERNREHFERTIQIRDHLRRATDHLTAGIEHPDVDTFIDGKKSPGEGIVLGLPSNVLPGKVHPRIKLVPTRIQYELGNNPRFPPNVKAKPLLTT